MAPPPRRPHVVVVGGGFAGRRAERLLLSSGRCDATVVDAAGFFEYTPAALRCCVRPEHAAQCVVPQPGRVRCAAVIALELDGAPDSAGDRAVAAVRLADGTRLACDYCLFCSGSSYAPPVKAPPAAAAAHPGPERAAAARRAHYRAVCVRLEAARAVLVVGGGTVGVELAAEVAARWAGRKAVTLVCAQDSLLARMPPRAGLAAAAWLRGAGVDVRLGERVTDWGGADRGAAWGEPGEWRVRTSSGGVLCADAVFCCVGGAATAPYLQPLQGALSRPGGGANTLPTLRVRGLRNAYAAGDCAAHGAEATALAADVTAELAAANVLAAIARAPQSALGLVPAVTAVSLGPRNGVFQLNQLVLAGPFVAVLKWLIERMQMAAARETPLAATLWRLCESLTLAIGRVLFLGRAAKAVDAAHAA
jgi:NADH dehydrogenase FAD-containing subunit